MIWFAYYVSIALIMAVVIGEMHRTGGRPLPAVTCLIAAAFWPLSMLALAAVLVWWGMRTVGGWFR